MQNVTYLQHCLNKKGGLSRWPSELMPLVVYIAPYRWYMSSGDAEAYKYKQMVLNAFNTWQNVLQGAVSFVFTDSLNASNINLEWKRVERKSLGQCQFNYDDYGRFYSAEVSIGLSDGIICKRYMDENEVFHTILHEIGHAIGLIGHSPYIEDIMYSPHQYGRTSLSKRDIMSAKFLYRFDTGKTQSEILNQYSNYGAKNIDHLVTLMLSGKSDFQKTLETVSRGAAKDLIQENANIGELKKYLMHINSLNFNFNKSPKKGGRG